MTYAELEAFYHELVRCARERGVTCAITSGMACVYYGVAQTTRDCDLLCDPKAAEEFLDVIAATELEGTRAIYRGKLSPPLDRRWLEGGWTSHFVWAGREGDGAYLDIFGVPPRASSRWEDEIEDFYTGRHTVAEMKRTDREKDWPFATALGEQMLEAGHARGWLHVFDEQALLAMRAERPLPAEVVRARPVLELVAAADSRLRGAVQAEKMYWHELDKLRLGIARAAIRPYLDAVRKARIPPDLDLAAQHEIRVCCAEESLPLNPIRDYGVKRLASEARARLEEVVRPEFCRWLPDVEEYITFAP